MIAAFLLAGVTATPLAAITKNFDGVAGIAAIHLESGRRVELRADERYPMASVYKMPIALAFLQKADREKISLDTKVTLGPEDFHLGHSPIAKEAKGKPITISLRRLVMLTVRDSDNSTSDYILGHYVSPGDVTKVLKTLGVNDVDISRQEQTIIRQIHDEGKDVFWRDPRDTASPNGLADLLVKIHRNQVGLSPRSQKLLLEAMTTTQTGADRIRAGLPPGATLAHKTGTMPGTLNDVGIVTSPDGKHHVAIAVMTKWSGRPEKERAKVVAALTKAAYEALTR